MKTIKPISTISYNTTKFLTLKLEELTNSGLIAFWMFIEHHPEEDETKAHKHVYIEPNTRLDTDELMAQFIEKDMTPDKNGVVNDKPLKTLHFQKTNDFADWYYYGLHDRAYLMQRGEARKYHYGTKDFHVSDPDEALEHIHRIDRSKYQLDDKIMKMARDSYQTDYEILLTQGVPMAKWAMYREAIEMVRGGLRTKEYERLQKENLEAEKTLRNGRKRHEEELPPDEDDEWRDPR